MDIDLLETCQPYNWSFLCTRYVLCIEIIFIGHFREIYHNNIFVLQPKAFHNHCFQFLLGLRIVPRETENNGYAKRRKRGGGGGGTKRLLWYF